MGVSLAFGQTSVFGCPLLSCHSSLSPALLVAWPPLAILRRRHFLRQAAFPQFCFALPCFFLQGTACNRRPGSQLLIGLHRCPSAPGWQTLGTLVRQSMHQFVELQN